MDQAETRPAGRGHSNLISSVTVRFVVVALLTLLSNIPLMFVSHLVDERAQYHEEAIDHVGRAWGGPQTLQGPILLVPEIREVIRREGSHLGRDQERVTRVILPNQLQVRAGITHEHRQRSIYTVPVYRSDVRFSGDFVLPSNSGELLWDEATIVVGVAAPHAVGEVSDLKFADGAFTFTGGTGANWLGAGIHAEVSIDPTLARLPFQFEMDLKGTRSFAIAPLGAQTVIDLQSTWPHPSFAGRFLPDSHEISDDGFTAQWSLNANARNLPGTWVVDADEPPYIASLEVKLFQPTTPYVLIDRGLKYAMLFISLTFLCFLAMELRRGLRVHYVQYGVVALGLILFYVTLLSLSEHIGFAWAYTLAAFVLTALVSWYAWLVSRKVLGRVVGVSIAGLLICLYLCLYVLLLLQAYALLVGTGVLLVSLVVLMYVTADLGETETA